MFTDAKKCISSKAIFTELIFQDLHSIIELRKFEGKTLKDITTDI